MLCDGRSLVLGSICPMAAPTHPPGSRTAMNCQGAMFGIIQRCSIEKTQPESQRSDTSGENGHHPHSGPCCCFHYKVPSEAALQQEYPGHPLEEHSNAGGMLSVWGPKRSDPAEQLFHLPNAGLFLGEKRFFFGSQSYFCEGLSPFC